MNRDIKELCKLAGTHTGRRTFIVNALSLGITPNIVMKWTGHSDYKAMKPYIDMTRSKKCVITAKTRWKKCETRDFSSYYLSE